MSVDTTNVTGETRFASLKPSLVLKVNVGDSSPIGEVSNGSNHYHFVCALIDQSRAQRADRHTRQPTAAPSSLLLEAAWTWTSKSSSGGTGYSDADQGRARVNLRGVAKSVMNLIPARRHNADLSPGMQTAYQSLSRTLA